MTIQRTLVSLTFDDGLDVHLDAAAPVLEQHGLRGTFYVSVGSESFTSRHADWAQAAVRRHELGNHTVFHPGVSSKSWVTEGIALEHYSLDRMRCELLAANRILATVDGRNRRSFAFPCSNPWLGRPGWPRRSLARLGLERTRVMGFVDRHGWDFGSRLVDYTPVVRELFPSARCGGIEPGDLPRQPSDWHRVRAVSGDGLDFARLRAALETAIARCRWVSFVFHGIGGGHHLSIDLFEFERFVAHLGADERVQVLPFLEAADQLQEERTKVG